MRFLLCISVAALACLTGCSDEPEKPEAATVLPDAPITAEALTQGQALYVKACLQCHQYDGSGVPAMQPALIDNPAVAGEPEHLIEVVLRGMGGTDSALPPSGEYAMTMPASDSMTDTDIANLLTYIRQAYVDEGPIKPEQVAAVRSKLE